MALNPPLPAWADARIWVIGASTGIGAAIARKLLAAGARVALSARSRDKLDAIAREAPGRAIVEALDFVDGAQVAAAWQRVLTAWGGIDLVLIVAGTHAEVRAWELDDQTTRAILATNLHAVIGAVTVVVPGLLAQGRGAIGIVGSVAGYRGLPKALVYGASKAAVINFTESLYLDLRPRGLGIYLVSPGFVRTPLTDRNDFRMPALISAAEAADDLLRGLRRGSFEIHFPRRFTNAMKLLQLLPYRWYFAVVRKVTGL